MVVFLWRRGSPQRYGDSPEVGRGCLLLAPPLPDVEMTGPARGGCGIRT